MRFPNLLGGRLSPAFALSMSVALAAAVTACDDNTGPAGSGTLEVTMSQTSSGGSASLTAAPSDAGTAGVVDLSNVTSVSVAVERVQVLRVDGDAWVDLTVVGGTQTVDLVDLPEPGASVTVAADQLEPGDYRNVRLFSASSTVTFSEDVTFPGQGGASQQTFEAGTAHDLSVPSAEETGLKVPTASFTISEGASGTVNVLADVDASVQSIVLTAEGLLMTPVLTAEASGSGG